MFCLLWFKLFGTAFLFFQLQSRLTRHLAAELHNSIGDVTSNFGPPCRKQLAELFACQAVWRLCAVFAQTVGLICYKTGQAILFSTYKYFGAPPLQTLQCITVSAGAIIRETDIPLLDTFSRTFSLTFYKTWDNSPSFVVVRTPAQTKPGKLSYVLYKRGGTAGKYVRGDNVRREYVRRIRSC